MYVDLEPRGPKERELDFLNRAEDRAWSEARNEGVQDQIEKLFFVGLVDP